MKSNKQAAGAEEIPNGAKRRHPVHTHGTISLRLCAAAVYLLDVFLGSEGVEALLERKRSRLDVLVQGDAAVQQARQRFARIVVLLPKARHSAERERSLLVSLLVPVTTMLVVVLVWDLGSCAMESTTLNPRQGEQVHTGQTNAYGQDAKIKKKATIVAFSKI